MSRLDDFRAVVDAVFRQRMEEIQALELVTELGVKRKTTAPKLLVLCRPIASSSGVGGGTMSFVNTSGKDNRVRVKQVFAISRLRDITHDGKFDATFNFGASGMFSVSFESHIQREMFVSTVRRQLGVQLQQQGHGGAIQDAHDVTNIRGVLSAAVGAEADADAASRVRKLRQEKRRVFSTAEEQHLLKFMGRSSFDDVKGFQEVLLGRQKAAELTSLNELVQSAEAWNSVRDQIASLVQEVEELESRIEEYSSDLMSKKSVIQQIEHSNNTLRQKQQNLEQLYTMMVDLRSQLSLKPEVTTLLSDLHLTQDADLAAFFSQKTNAAELSKAMHHMRLVLQNPQLDADYPIAAVSERKTFFLEQRRMIAKRSQSYILSVISDSERQMLEEKSRFSRDDRLTWRLHSELTTKLLAVSDIINSLPHIDPEGYTSVLRKYRTSMQRVYALEISQFLKGMRRQVKKVNSWKGPFLLGTSETKDDAMTMRMETAQAGETPRMWRSTPAPTPPLTPRAMGGFGDDQSSAGGGDAGGAHRAASSGDRGRMLTIEFPASFMFSADVELYADSNTLRRLDVRAATGSVSGTLRTITSLGQSSSASSSKGYLRPDLAFAIVLESAIMCILQEEYVLRSCFGIGEDAARVTGSGAASLPGQSVGLGGARAGSVDSAPGTDTRLREEFDATATDTIEQIKAADAPTLMLESLLELLGGDKLAGLHMVSEGLANGAAGPGGAHARTSSRDLGLPPRYPQSPRGGADIGGFHSRGGSTDSSMAMPLLGSASVDTDAGKGQGPPVKLSDEELKRVRSNFLIYEIVETARFFFEKCDRIYAVPALCMVKAYRRGAMTKPAHSVFCQALVRDLETVATAAMMRYVAEQTESINRCKQKYLVKPTPLLHCFSKMPAFILRMEAVHNSLSVNVCDRADYTSIVSSLVDQSFDALDYITNVRANSDSGQTVKLKVGELIVKKINRAVEATATGASSLKRGFVQQYRHHAFFCAFFATLPRSSYAADLLQDHNDSSKAKRDRYEEMYLTRVLLVREFPKFGPFTIDAEDLSVTYTQDELRHHRALSADAVRGTVEDLKKEMRSGVRASATRMKKHFLQDVVAHSNEESFHRTLLQRTWQHFSQLILQKFDFLERLLKWPTYQGITLPLTHADVTQMLSEF